MNDSVPVSCVFQYGKEKNCFLSIAPREQGRHKGSTQRFNNDDNIQVYETKIFQNKRAFLSFHGNTEKPEQGDVIQLNRMFAGKLGIQTGDNVILEALRSPVPIARRLQVEPLSPDDWEILDTNASKVESVLLDQVRVVWPKQIFPVWIQPSLCVYLSIVTVEPVEGCAILETNTEIVVAPKLRANPPSSLGLPDQKNFSSRNKNCDILPQASSTPKPHKNWNNSAHDSSNDTPMNQDTLEPRPHLLSPSWTQPRVGKRHSNRLRNSFVHDKPLENKRIQPFLRRESSLMESVVKYIFKYTGISKDERENEFDLRSESDASSGIDYSSQNLPSRNAVARIQPMRLSTTIEECFPVGKSHINRQIISTSFSSWKSKTRLPDIPAGTNQNSTNSCHIPLELFQPSTVYVEASCLDRERMLHPYLPLLPNNFIACLRHLPSPSDKAEQDKKLSKSKKDAPEPQEDKNQNRQVSGASDQSLSELRSCYVRVVVIDRKAGLTDELWQDAADRLLTEQPLLYNHAIIPDLLRRQLKLDATGSVWIQTGTVSIIIPRKVVIFPLTVVPRKITNDMLITAFNRFIKQCADANHPMVVFQGMLLKFVIFPENSAEVQLTFYGENDFADTKAVTMLSELNIDSILVIVEKSSKEDKLSVVEPMLSYTSIADLTPTPPLVKLKNLGGTESISKAALTQIKACLAARPLSQHVFKARAGLCHGMLLITGPKGSGKTALAKALCRKMSHLPTLAFTIIMDCKSMRGKAVSHIQKILESVFDEAAWREPSVIVFDNLDVILPAPSGPETEMNGEALYSAKNSEVLQGLIKYELENNSRISVIATALSRKSLHASIVTSRGQHWVQQVVSIGVPDKVAREKILNSIIRNHSSIAISTLNYIDLHEIALKTEGFVALDLQNLVNRALHNRLISCVRGSKDKLVLTSEHFELALEHMKPVSIRTVPLHKAGDLGWDDVGGLNDVKTALIETLKWPAKYSKLFSSCPLRLRSGILLYGAPGTGKTLLAGVVAKECGLNFISIKGPELLSKFIGASEQAVRDLFQRAQSAKPCVLFFDEFDSIAPKRGHDSTGVTDRVVNQLLTQLDGVEGLQGVYVLAATSRPDLIDPALLRPGRLDKCINCAIPNQEERTDILYSLTSKMNLCTDVDLEEISSLCPYFTGADFKALLYNAQLKAIHQDSGRDTTDNAVRIKGDDLSCSVARRASQNLDPEVLQKLHIPEMTSSSYDSDLNESESILPQSGAKREARLNVQMGSGSDDPVQHASINLDYSNVSKANNQARSQILYDLAPKKKSYDSVDGLLPKSESVLKFENISVIEKLESVPDDQIELSKSSNSNGKLDNKTNDIETDGIECELMSKLLNDKDEIDGILKKNTELKPGNKTDSNKKGEMIKIQVSEPENEKMKKSYVPHLNVTKNASKRKRAFQRESGSALQVIEGQSSEAKSPSMEKPVAVFQKLSDGLATLSPEQEAHYLSMVREIHRRDDKLFEVANAKRRTSLQLNSKTGSLVEVCHDHLVEAARSMKPSVTISERLKYHTIYKNFISSRAESSKKEENQGTTKRATLA